MSNANKPKKKTVIQIAEDIKDESQEDLEGKIFNLSKALTDANKIIDEKNAEIEELKKHLDSLTPHLGKISKITVSDEEVIANVQLQRIKEAALTRALSMEESKIFDIMVKNKKLAQGDASDVINVNGLSKELKKEDLIKIAAGVKPLKK